jgi:outer membrane scaffolding protein for murein synthesis (MipA/OmpV family)
MTQHSRQLYPVMRLCIVLMLVFLCALAAHAADPRPAQQIENNDDEEEDPPQKNATGPDRLQGTASSEKSEASGLAELFSPLRASDWSLELGIKSRVTGTRGTRKSINADAGLLFDIRWRELLFLSTDRGIGINLFQKKGVLAASDSIILGAALSISDSAESDRSRSQSRSLDATRRSSGFTLGFAEYRTGQWNLWAEIARYHIAQNGTVVSLGVEYRQPLTNKWQATFAWGLSAGDGAYMRDNFTVAPLLSLARRPLFIQPKAGLRDTTVSVDFEYQADEHWRWSTVLGFTQSLAVVQQGAWVKVRSQPFISTGIKYKF